MDVQCEYKKMESIMKTESARKEVRINLRANQEQKELLKKAAELKNTTVSNFILENATKAAQEAILAQTHFFLSEEKWIQFCEILDRPPKEIPALRKLLTEPTIFDEQ